MLDQWGELVSTYWPILAFTIVGVFSAIAGLAGAVWKVWTYFDSRNNQSSHPELRLKIEHAYPSIDDLGQDLEQRMDRVEALLLRVLRAVGDHEDEIHFNPTVAIARQILERAKQPNARLIAQGMEISASTSDISAQAAMSLSTVQEALQILEDQGLIKRELDDRIVVFGTQEE